MLTSPRAVVVADSIYPGGKRLTSVQGTTERWILAEVNTHRALVKSSASSRAIPFEKQLKAIWDQPAMPHEYPREQSGMQGGEPLSESDRIDAETLWREVRRNTWTTLGAYLKRHPDKATRLHKQYLNRLIEPWLHHTMLLTGAAWENFFDQRCSPMAQPEIRDFAWEIRRAIDASEPQVLKPGQWHMPYITEEMRQEVPDEDSLARVSVGMSARTSYDNALAEKTVEEQLALFDGLVSKMHWTPLEHVATPWPENIQWADEIRYGSLGENVVSLEHLARIGPLPGWRTMRTTVEAERGITTYR